MNDVITMRLMKLPRNPKSVVLVLFFLVSFVPQVVQHFDSLFFSLPYLNAAAVVVYSCTVTVWWSQHSRRESTNKAPSGINPG